MALETDTFEKVEVTSSAQLRDWLEANHGQQESVWLVTYRKHVADRFLSTGEVLDELLCFGWIDGIRRKLDDDRTMQLVGPRRTGRWAKSYKDRVDRLIEEDRMHPAGLRPVEEAKCAGIWSVTDDVDALIVPDDLEHALSAFPNAAAWFAASARSYRRNVLRWLKQAVAAETRGKRIARIVDASAAGRKLPQM